MSSASLFSRLLDLQTSQPGRVPLEDYFTEMVAFLFESSPAILFGWLGSLGWVFPDELPAAEVSTQARYAALAEQLQGSRPDLRIELLAGERRDLIFIESKIGATEGAGQLQRYAELLAAESGAGERWLIFLTRNWEPKDQAAILRSQRVASVHFVQQRWHAFYNFLRSQPEDLFTAQVARFMEENGMGNPVQFSAADLQALGNLQHPFALMLAVLDQEMQRSYHAAVGERGKLSPVELLTEVWARFALEGEIVPGALNLRLGFDGLAIGEPRLFVMFQVKPLKGYAPHFGLRAEMIQLLRSILNERPGWFGWDLDDPKAYAGIQKNQALSELLAAGEVVEVCRAVLVAYLDEVGEIRRAHPEINWKR